MCTYRVLATDSYGDRTVYEYDSINKRKFNYKDAVSMQKYLISDNRKDVVIEEVPLTESEAKGQTVGFIVLAVIAFIVIVCITTGSFIYFLIGAIAIGIIAYVCSFISKIFSPSASVTFGFIATCIVVSALIMTAVA